MNLKSGFGKHVLTLLTFCALCVAVPFLFINYCVLQYCRRIWLAILSNRFPHLEFVKTHSVRSLVDSWRNPAVINVLVEIKGKCNKSAIRSAVSEHLLSRSCLVGKTSATCRHLRKQLTSCWGSSAWCNDDEADDASFDVAKHVVCAPKIYRGRPVSEANIQEYVSSITKKYLPSNQPPWQIVIVPNIVSLEEKYYVVVRIHHLLLAKEHNLNIGDFLMLKRTTRYDFNIPTPQYIPTRPLPENYIGMQLRRNKKQQKHRSKKVSNKSSEESFLDSDFALPKIVELKENSQQNKYISNENLQIMDSNIQIDAATSNAEGMSPELLGQGSSSGAEKLATTSLHVERIERNLNPNIFPRDENTFDIFEHEENLKKIQLINEQLSKAHSEIAYDYNKSKSLVKDLDIKCQNPKRSPLNYKNKSPLLDIFENLTAGPELMQRINVTLANLWNEFKGTHDPLEWPQKGRIGLAGLIAIILIVLGVVWKDVTKGAFSPKASLAFRSWYVKASIEKEFARRDIKFSTIFSALFNTINPVNLLKFYATLWLGFVLWLLKVPLNLSKEMLAIISIIRTGYCGYSNTWCFTLNEFLPLIYGTCKELCYIFSVIYHAPMTMLGELFPRDSQKSLHSLQTVSLCGRKVVAWSNSISIDVIREIACKTGVTTTEVMLSAACGALADYFRENNEDKPTYVHATVRHVEQDFLLMPFSPQRSMHRDRIGGVVCISLPLEYTENPDDCLKNLEKVKECLEHSRSQQKAMYGLSLIQTKYGLVTRALPSVLSKLSVNYLSRKFAVTLTEVGTGIDDSYNISTSDESFESKYEYKNPMETEWGHEVTGVMYWRPPQANISMSITFQAYGSHMRMGVMADGQLSPYHSQMTDSWLQRIWQLAAKTSVSCDIVLRVPTIDQQTNEDDTRQTQIK